MMLEVAVTVAVAAAVGNEDRKAGYDYIFELLSFYLCNV